MTSKTVVTLVALAAASFAAGAFAEDASRFLGAAPSHKSVERYDMSVGVTAGQLPRLPSKFEEVREVLHVPSHYGQLAGVTSDGSSGVFWFRDADGALRNVVVPDAATRPMKLVCAATSRYEAEQR